MANDFWILLAMVIYFAAMLSIGFIYSKRSNSSSKEYFAGGRGVGPWLTALSAEASDMSGWLLMGLPGLAYFTGAADPMWTAVGLALGTYLNWKLVARRLRRYSVVTDDAITIPDFFAKRFHDKKGVISTIAAVIILVFFSVYVGSCFVTVGKLFATLFGFDYHVMMIIGAVVVFVYTVVGGYLSVVMTDFIQGMLMFFALAVVFIGTVASAGGVDNTVEFLRAIPGYLSGTQVAAPKLDPATGKLAFTHNQSDPLPADAVIVDETSMVDITLMSALLSALRGDCRLVLVGDPDQLPSVGPGNLLSDLLRSGRVPAVRLTEIFRQAQESAIVMNAHLVNQGQVPDLLDNSRDFFCLRRYDSARAVDTVVELCKTRLPKNMGIPTEQIQVLTPTRKRGGGTAALNRAIQAAVNPPDERKGERAFGEYVFRLGDRVMQTRNNYDVFWEDPRTGEQDLGVFNGDIGVIEGVNVGDAALVVNFEGRIVQYTADMLNELEPAYAITVHKAQGSEYRAVILVVSEVPQNLLTRGVLYTAITRARELLILVGDDRAVAQMIANNKQTRRYSGLRARLTRSAEPSRTAG